MAKRSGRMTDDKRGFIQGVAYAAWCLHDTMGEPTTAAEVCFQLGVTLRELEQAGVDPDIVAKLRPEMEHKERLRHR